MTTPINPPAYIQAGEYDASTDRQHLITARFFKDISDSSRARQGLLFDRLDWLGDVSNVGFDVTISPFRAIVTNTFSSNEGDYMVVSPSNADLVITGSGATTNRIDTIGVQIRDAFYSGADSDAQVVVIEGSATSGTPAAPLLPPSFLPLWDARVDANVSEPTFTDRRRYTGLQGTVLPVGSVQEPDDGSVWGELQYVLGQSGRADRLRIWSAIEDWWDLQYRNNECRFAKDGAQTIDNFAVTTLSFETEEYGAQDILPNAGRTRWTIHRPGILEVTGTLTITGGTVSGAGARNFWVRTLSDNVTKGLVQERVSSTDAVMNFHAPFEVDAGEEIEFYANSQSTANVSAAGGWVAMRLRPRG